MKSRIIFQLMFAAATLLAVASSWAQPADPVELTRQTVNEVMTDMKTNEAVYSADHSKLDAMVQERLVPRFNFTVMTQLAVGRAWTQASPEQKSALENEFRALLTRTYTNVLFNSRNETTSIRSNSTTPQGDVTIELDVSSAKGEPFMLTFRMRQANNEWKVIDVSVNGVSLIVNYRNTFSREINQSGLDGLIKTLQEKNRTNSE